jgi:hypothetical protein
MADNPALIRFHDYNDFTFNKVKDESNKLFFEFKDIPEYFRQKRINQESKKFEAYRKKITLLNYDNKFANNLLIVCPGNDEYKINDSNYYLKQLTSIIDNDDKLLIDKKIKSPYIYKYTKPKPELGNYLLYVPTPIITDLDDQNQRLSLVKIGVTIGLLIELYNSVKPDKIKNIRLPGIGTLYVKNNSYKLRYYLNYARDLLLHSLVATLHSKRVLQNIESIQFCNQKSNQYDIFGSEFYAQDDVRELNPPPNPLVKVDDRDKDLDILIPKDKYKRSIEYYLFNGMKYIKNFNLGNVSLEKNTLFCLQDEIGSIATNDCQITIKSIYDDYILNDANRTVQLAKYKITDIYAKYPSPASSDAYVNTLGGKINICQGISNLCWFNSANQFLLSINEVANYLLKIDPTAITTDNNSQQFFTIIQNVLKSYVENTYDFKNRKKIIGDNAKLLFQSGKIDNYQLLNITDNLKFNLGNLFEPVTYLNSILSIEDMKYNSSNEFFNLLINNISISRIKYVTMFYGDLKNKKAVSFCGNIFESYFSNDYLIFGNHVDSLIVLLSNIKESDIVNVYKDNSTGTHGQVHFPYLETKKYIFVNCCYGRVVETNQPLYPNKCNMYIELLNGQLYVCKSFIINTGGHYICYKLSEDKTKYLIYDDTKIEVADYPIPVNYQLSVRHNIECILYEKSDVVPVASLGKQLFFDAGEYTNSDKSLMFVDGSNKIEELMGYNKFPIKEDDDSDSEDESDDETEDPTKDTKDTTKDTTGKPSRKPTKKQKKIEKQKELEKQKKEKEEKKQKEIFNKNVDNVVDLIPKTLIDKSKIIKSINDLLKSKVKSGNIMPSNIVDYYDAIIKKINNKNINDRLLSYKNKKNRRSALFLKDNYYFASYYFRDYDAVDLVPYMLIEKIQEEAKINNLYIPYPIINF